MKKLLSVTLLLLFTLTTTFAQVSPKNPDATMEDYERFIDKKLEMNFRLSAMEAINLTSEEISAFNPVFDNYITAKDRLSDKKFKILEAYAEEMREESDADDRAEETSDLIEDYWEAEIAEMELKKDYYDRLEDKIPFQKAIDFFLYEETVENDMKYDILVPTMPTVINIEKKKKARKAKKMAANKPATVTTKDWNRYIDKKLEMDFRLAAIDAMYLTSDEIEIFNPFFDKYMDEKEELTEKKFTLIEKYTRKIERKDNVKGKEEKMSDFIEDYWEAEIKTMALKEKYFDRMENKLPYMKVAQFFFLEETIENRLKYDAMISKMPTIIIIDQKMEKMREKDAAMNENSAKVMDSSISDESTKPAATTMMENNTQDDNSNNGSMSEEKEEEPKTNDTSKNIDASESTSLNYATNTSVKVAYNNEMTSFDNWVKTTRGQMSLSHDYTSNGLKAAARAIEATATATNTTIENWENKKSEIMYIANQITIDPKSTMHADWVHEAFVTIGSVVKTLNESNQYTYAHGQVSLLQHYAKQINPDVLLMKQADTVYNFFGTTNQALKEIWDYAAKDVPTAEVATTNAEE